MISKSAKIISVSLGLLFSFSALANSAETNEQGAKLDIRKVVSISAKDAKHGPTRELTDYVMKYVDSSGETQTLEYRGLSKARSRGR